MDNHLGPWVGEVRYIERLEKALYEGKREYGDDVWVALAKRLGKLEGAGEDYPAGKVWYQKRALKLAYRALLDLWDIGDFERRTKLVDELLKNTFMLDLGGKGVVGFVSGLIGLHDGLFASQAGMAIGVSTAWHEALHYIRINHQDLIPEVDETSLLGSSSTEAVELLLMMKIFQGADMDEVLEDIRKDVPLERIVVKIAGDSDLEAFQGRLLNVLEGLKMRLEQEGPMHVFADIRELSRAQRRAQNWPAILQGFRKTWEEEEVLTTLRGEQVTTVNTYQQGPKLSGFALGLAHELQWPDALTFFLTFDFTINPVWL